MGRLMQLQALLEASAARFPEKTALVCDEARHTFRSIDRAANRLANALVDGGVEIGDRVVIHLNSSPEAAVAIFAVLKAGGVFVVLHPSTKAQKLAYVLADSGATALVTDARKLASTGAVLDALPDLATVYVADSKQPNASATAKRMLSQRDLPTDEPSAAQPPARRLIDLDLAALIYTSGSTGAPKGVMMTHRSMVAAATSITMYLESRPEDVVLSALPLSFDYGLYQWLMCARMGSTLVLERSFAYPAVVLQRLVRERVTGFPVVPTLLAMFLRMDLGVYDLSALSYVSNTGAAMPPSHIAELRRRLPHVRIYSMYGLTECKRVSYLHPDQIDARPDSVGKAMPNTEAYVVDDHGRRLGPGEVGQLVVRGATIMRGYWGDPEATGRVLRPGPVPGERVLYTGDLFRTDDEGYLYFVGRTDDIIKSRGEKVSPRELEDVICRLDGIAEAAVVGVPDPVLGEGIHAFVTLRQGVELGPRAIQAHCAQHLESFMVPSCVQVRTSLPRTMAGKIDKRALQAETEKAHDRPD